ncbi:MAG: peptidylprolyl isomerase [Thermodesulfovibrionales bacterium]|nr:peptidylprolyl isomerase [Thermodesulfovibrionales bacterium]
MAQAQFGNTVKVHYTVRLDDGTVVDSTKDHEPFTFTIGVGAAIAGFEKEIMNMGPGESKTVKVGVEEAYGPYYKELIKEVDRSEFPDNFEFEVGQKYELPRGDGQSDLVVVLQVTEEMVILDTNHPLAGKDLTIDIQLMEIL